MKKPISKIVAAALSAALLTGGVAAAAHVRTGSVPAPAASVPTAASVKGDAPSAQSQTVYVISGADGAVDKIIVSDWIRDAAGGESAYTLDDNAQVWTEDGDVYAQRVVEGELPVSLSVSYQLDGRAIDPGALAGKSGRVTIRFDYTNRQYEYVDIGGRREKIYVPFAMLTGVLLDNERFTNVSVSNGKIFNDGNHTIAVGVALPGLGENLALDPDALEIPDYVEISADVENFELAMTVTLAANSPFSEIDPGRLDSLDDLSGAADELTGAMDQLMDGAGRLCSGLDSLLDGAGQVSDGVSHLAEGLNALTANNDALTGGARQVFDSLLAMANSQIAAAGLDLPALTADNYADVLNGVLAKLDQDAVIASVRAQVEQTVRQQEDKVRIAVTGAVEQEVSAKVEAAVKADVESRVLSAMGLESDALTDPRVQAAVKQQLAGSDAKTAIAGALAAQMESEEVQTLIEEKTEEQIQLLVDQNMAAAEVQAQITSGLAQADAGAAQLQSLKAQLDSYNAFYQGLIAYTGGVSEAAAGANTLNQAMPALLSGAEELKDGAIQLSDGLAAFNEEGIQKLVKALDGDLGSVEDRLRAMIDVSKRYCAFSDVPGSPEGEVKFVYKTGAIQLPED